MPAADATLQRFWLPLKLRMQEWTGVALGPRDIDSALQTLSELAHGRSERPGDYLNSLDGSARAADRQRLIDRLLIGATWFLREAAGIQSLTSALLRELGPGRSVRIWSAGCSTGQEPYGLAMALVEAGLYPQILATDINHESLRIAAAARYPTRLLAALPEKWRQRYVSRSGPDHGLIQTPITSVVHFAVHNLATTPKPPAGWGAFDAVVCRNVLMYFERERAAEVVRRFARSCRAGGYVLLSAAERPLAWMTEALEEIEKQYDVVLLRSAPTPAPAGRDESKPSMLPLVIKEVPPAPTSATTAALTEASRLMESAELLRAIQILDVLLAATPLLAAAHLLRGLALKRRGATEAAAAALRCARFLYADEAWLPPYHLGLVLEQLGALEEACEAYRHARAVVTAGGRSGLVAADGDEESLALTVAETCAARLRSLAAGDTGGRGRR